MWRNMVGLIAKGRAAVAKSPIASAVAGESLIYADVRGAATKTAVIFARPVLPFAIPRQLDFVPIRVFHVHGDAVAVVGRSVEGHSLIHRSPRRIDKIGVSRKQDRKMKQSWTVGCRWRLPGAFRAVKCKMMVVPTRGHENESIAAHGHFISKDLAVEGLTPLEVRNSQMHMPNAGVRIDGVSHSRSLLPRIAQSSIEIVGPCPRRRSGTDQPREEN